ncbi:MAG: class I SAM-dependent methyltransferase [Pseudomonadota bacterium]
MSSDDGTLKYGAWEAPQEADARRKLAELLEHSPIPPQYLIDNLSLYLRRHQLGDLLSLVELYQQILERPGIIMEFGVLHGRHMATFTALRALYEPFNTLRRVVGFDTFTGFPDIAEVDRVSPSAVPGRFAVTADGPDHLRAVLAAHESAEPYGHLERTAVIEGDVRETVPRFLEEHPDTIIALAYFDLDLYEPTRVVLDAIRPHLHKGSILAFDELDHPKWPGETRAVREAVDLLQLDLKLIPTREPPITYAKWV